MRYLLMGALLAVSVQASAENGMLAKLTAEGLCKEYGYQRETPELDNCMDSVLKAAAKPEARESVGRLFDAYGEVKAISGGKEFPLAKGALLGNDMLVSTGKGSHAVLKFADGQVVALEADTLFHIHDYRYDPANVRESDIFFSLEKGGLRSINGIVGNKHPAAFRLETPGATMSVHETDFMVVAGRHVYAQVSGGVLQVDNQAGTAVLISGQGVDVADGEQKPVMVGADKLPQGLFAGLARISVPDTDPMQTERQATAQVVVAAAAPVAVLDDPAMAKLRANGEKVCEGYGYIRGSEKFDWCVETSIKASAAKPVQEEQDSGIGKIYAASGDVTVETSSRQGGKQKLASGKGSLLKEKMTIRTGEKSQAVLKFQDGQVIAMRPNTAFQIRNYRYDAKDPSQDKAGFSLIGGGIRAVTGEIGHKRPEAFELNARRTMLGVRGTDFMVDMEDILYAQVTTGSISLGGEAGTLVLDAGQVAAVVDGAAPVKMGEGEQLPQEVAARLTGLGAMQLPSPTPDGGSKPREDGAPPVQAGGPQETFCENYGYTKGSQAYEECRRLAGNDGYQGDAEKHQASQGSAPLQEDMIDPAKNKKRRDFSQ